MGFLILAAVIIFSVIIGINSNNHSETISSLSEETQTLLPTPTTTPKPTIKPLLLSPTPIPTPKPSDDYLTRLTKCLKDKESDPLTQNANEDKKILNNPDSTSKEKISAIARLDTYNIIISLKYDCFGTNFSTRPSDDLEKVWLIKDINSGDNVIIKRRNGEQWLLEAKTWCSWCWRYEDRQVYLKFGYVTSKLINDDGDVTEFWTEEEL